MKININWFIKIKKIFNKIKLIDKFLIIIMSILFIQLVYNLFINEIISQNTHIIDVFVRTTIASIFGYFISSNFIKNETNSSNKSNNFANNQKFNSKHHLIRHTKYSPSNLQIIIVSILCIISLIVLILARNFTEMDSSSLATISQLRDIICGCIGFLIGCPNSNNIDKD